MTHTYLFQEGLWVASGDYFDAAGAANPVKGHNRVTHGSRWKIESFMQLMTDARLVFENNYEVMPFTLGADSTMWTAHNPAIGEFNGRFFLIGDTILSIYASADGQFTASEFLLRQDDDHYLNRGAFFQEQDRVSAWSVKLTRAGK